MLHKTKTIRNKRILILSSGPVRSCTTLPMRYSARITSTFMKGVFAKENCKSHTLVDVDTLPKFAVKATTRFDTDDTTCGFS